MGLVRCQRLSKDSVIHSYCGHFIKKTKQNKKKNALLTGICYIMNVSPVCGAVLIDLV